MVGRRVGSRRLSEWAYGLGEALEGNSWRMLAPLDYYKGSRMRGLRAHSCRSRDRRYRPLLRVEKDPEFIIPIWTARWIEPIRPYGNSRPNNAYSQSV
jgi:hypothetical protein